MLRGGEVLRCGGLGGGAEGQGGTEVWRIRGEVLRCGGLGRGAEGQGGTIVSLSCFLCFISQVT